MKRSPNDPVEEEIKKAQERGDFDNLPGKGKPLEFLEVSENPFIDRGIQMTYKLLKDAGFSPAWIELDKEIRSDLQKAQKLLEACKSRCQCLSEKIVAAGLAPAKAFESYRKRVRKEYIEILKALNPKIERFNLIVPVKEKQRRKIDLLEAIKKFDSEGPSI